MAEGLAPVVKFGVEEPYKIISSRVASSKNLEDMYDLLNQGIQRLLAVKEDNEIQVQKHKQNHPTKVYCSWRTSVSDIATEVDNLRAEYKRKRLPTWLFFRRSSLCEKVVKRHNRVKELIEEGQSINILDDHKYPEAVLKVFDAPKITEYPTLENALEGILSCLKNKRIKSIGVHGTKGVGKTTILRNLNNCEEVCQLFNMVIFITVSADQDGKKLQQSIATRLNIDIEATKCSNDEVATRIHEELKHKKFLLILDGVVDLINLKELGIPDNDNGSKVVMASQSVRVCNDYNMDKLIEVKQLQPKEAWKMFRDIVGSAIDHPGIQPIARRACNRCSCLPLLIWMIGRSFRSKKDARRWRAGLEDLDERWRKHQDEGLKELYSSLEFCYDQLREREQKCFLYASLYPADSKVFTDYLVECWVAQGFLGCVNEGRYQKARDQGHMILGELTDASLLEKGEGMLYVTINGCMRQLGLYILTKHPHSCYIHVNEESEELPLPKTWVNAKWVSMIDTKLCNLPTSQDCSMLETLLLQKNPELATIPQTFFENMSNLLVLDLHGTGIIELPSSLSNLTGLKGLYLNSCKYLSNLPPQIASLQFLEVLDIRGSQVSFLPSCIGSLTNLRCLRIPYIKSGDQSGHQGMKDANYYVISELQKIEELIIEVISYEQWCKQAKNIMDQVALLKRLTTLGCSFPSSKILSSFVARWEQWRDRKQFTSFQFFIGCRNSQCPQFLQHFEDGLTKYLKYYNGEKGNEVMGEVICETDAFELISHKDIKKLSDLGIENLNYLRGLWIEKCNKLSTIIEGDRNGLRNGSILPSLEQLYLINLPNLEYVFKGPPLPFNIFCKLHTLKLENCSKLKSIFDDGRFMRMDDTGDASILPNLEKLYLKNLPELNCVFKGPLHPRTFSKLQILALENCSSLESIFNNGVIQNFSELRKLEIRDCLEIKELLVVSEDIERKEDLLPILERIELFDLPNLQFICRKQILAWSSLVLLKVHECPNLKSLPFQRNKAVKLRSIIGNKRWWNALKETNKEVHHQFQDIFVATIADSV